MKYHFLIILISLIKLSYNLPNDQIYELNDFTFDYLISEGKKYRWLIFFYLSTCGHCEHAKEEILKIYKNYSETNIRFAKMEIQKSWTASLRFNISGVPYIILVENNKIYELQKYPNDKNLIEFLNTSFNDVKDEIVDFPKQMNLFNDIWGIFSQYVRGLREYISLAIYYYTGIEYEVQPSQIFVGGIFFMIIFGLIEYWLLSLCFGNDDEKKDNDEKKEEEKKEDNKKSFYYPSICLKTFPRPFIEIGINFNILLKRYSNKRNNDIDYVLEESLTYEGNTGKLISYIPDKKIKNPLRHLYGKSVVYKAHKTRNGKNFSLNLNKNNSNTFYNNKKLSFVEYNVLKDRIFMKKLHKKAINKKWSYVSKNNITIDITFFIIIKILFSHFLYNIIINLYFITIYKYTFVHRCFFTHK